MRRIKGSLSLVLCSAFLLGSFHVVSFAAEEDGLCEHHTVHAGCGYVAAVEGKACEFVCEACAAEEASAAAVAEVKALVDALPELEAVQAMSMEDQKAAYEQTQAAYEAYGKLTADQQEMADPEEVFKPLFEYFNTLIDADGEIGSGTPDGTPPTLISLAITSATTITAPGTIKIVAEASDDVSGVDYVFVDFKGQTNGKWLSCGLHDTYWENGNEVPYADGKLHGKITIDEYLESDTFKLNSASVVDIAGNTIFYERNYNESLGLTNRLPFADYMEAIQFAIVETEIVDGIPPSLTNLSISTDSVTAPGTIEVVAEASDDVSGVDYVFVDFKGQTNGKWLSCGLHDTYWENGNEVPYADGKLHGKITIDEYLESDTFKLNSASVVDIAGNTIFYERNYNESFGLTNRLPFADYMTAMQFTIIESMMADGTPPSLTNLTISTDSVTAPGTIEVVAEASDDVSGVDYVFVDFKGQTNSKWLSCGLHDTYWENGIEVSYADGKLHGTITISQYLETDTFELNSASVVDIAGNTIFYERNYNENLGLTNRLPFADYMTAMHFTVTNAGADITTSTNRSTFIEDVTNAANDAYIVADFSSNSTLPQGAFDGIAGTNKTLDLTSEGVTWRFEGNDITEDTKSIDLSVQITKAESNTSDAGQAIQDKLNDTPGYIMKFAENGELPGKATIQIKVDYAMREHLGSSTGLNVYYYNNQTGKLELIAENLSVINDTYVEFSITHCSYYVLTTELSNEPDVKTITCPYTEEITLTKSEEDKYYSFTPTVSGVYVASVPWFDGKGDSGSYVEITDDSGVIGRTDGYQTDYRVARATLEAGKTYTIHIGATGASAGQKLTFAFAQSTAPTGVNIGRETDELFILPGGSRGSVSANLMPINAVGDITWSCDSTDVIQLRNDTGYNCSFNILKAGTAVLTASCGNYQDTITITIKEPDVLTKGAVVSGQTYVDKGDGFYYYSFTANEAGRYEFVTRNLSAHQIVTDFDFANEDNEAAYDVQSKVNGAVRRDYITLEAGQSCIFHLVAYDECDYTVIVNEAQSCGSSAYWHFDLATGTLTISGTGYFSGFYVDGGRKYYWEEHLNDIKRIVIEEGITQIGSHAFEGCKNATEVSIPDSITTVGYGAFTDCASLGTVVLPAHIPELYLTFNGCSSLKNVTLPTSITGLYGTFMDCSSLESVEIPESVTIIDTMTFIRCTALKEFTVPDQIAEIGAVAFLDCTNLKKVTFEGNAPNIWEAIDDHPDGRGAFAGCVLTAYYPVGNTTWTEEVMKQYGGNITWKPYCPNGHTVVTDKAVEATCTATGLTEGKHCSGCGEVIVAQTVIPAKGHTYESVVWRPLCSDPGYTEHTCSLCGDRYTSDEVPATGVHNISFTQGHTQCYGCGRGCTISELAFIGSYGDDAFWKVKNGVLTIYPALSDSHSYHEEAWIYYVGDSTWQRFYRELPGFAYGNVKLPEIHTVEIKPGITQILAETFFDASGTTEFTEVIIPDTVVSIGAYAFSGCKNLENIVIPDSVTAIEEGAFQGCDKLISITIPKSVESIADDVFWYSNNLTSIWVDQENPYYSSDDAGVLYNKDQTVLKLVPFGYKGTCIIPRGVQEIASFAVFYCTDLNCLVIPSTVNSLDTESGAFLFGCTGLEHVIYCGTEEELDSLGIVIPDYTELQYHAPEDGVESNCTDAVICMICGEEVALGHTEVIDEAVAPTCTATGLTEGKHCSVCNEVLEAQEVIPALEHNFIGGKCEFCDRSEPIKGDLNDDGKITDRDAVELLWYALCPELCPDGFYADFNGDGNTDIEDAVYLIWYTLFPILYPIR